MPRRRHPGRKLVAGGEHHPLGPDHRPAGGLGLHPVRVVAESHRLDRGVQPRAPRLRRPQQPGAVALEQALQAQVLAARLVAGTSVRESRGAVVAVLVLAIWLGLSTLNYSSAPAALLYGAAVAFALSRPYLGVHYPSDVAAGAVLGTAIAEAWPS